MEKLYQKVTWALWLALVATLPITSMPFVAKLFHSSAVAPASLIFLLALILLWLPVYIWKRGTFPFQTKLILAFFLVALISVGVSFFLEQPAYKDHELSSSVMEGVATLTIGVLFYLASVALPSNENKLQGTLRVLNWGGAVMILWTVVVQGITQFTPSDTPQYLRVVQHLFSTTTFFGTRAVGFASEPSWLAHMVNLVYIPYWLSATITRHSAHKVRLGKITFENLLLIGGIGTLFVTFSRAGWVAFMLVVAFLFIRLNIWIVSKISQKWHSQRLKAIFTIGFVLMVILIYVLIAAGALYTFSKLDPRMANVFSVETLTKGGLAKYADLLQFGERVTYWQTGWRIFNEHPILGVGVGNAGYYFPDLLPDEAWQLSEVRTLIYHSTNLLNIKSLWVRVLAETGIIGFSFFFVFLIVSLFTSKSLTRSSANLGKAIGWMGIYTLIAYIIEGFSVDSFALPYLWFSLGLVAATWRWIDTQSKV